MTEGTEMLRLWEALGRWGAGCDGVGITTAGPTLVLDDEGFEGKLCEDAWSEEGDDEDLVPSTDPDVLIKFGSSMFAATDFLWASVCSVGFGEGALRANPEATQ